MKDPRWEVCTTHNGKGVNFSPNNLMYWAYLPLFAPECAVRLLSEDPNYGIHVYGWTIV